MGNSTCQQEIHLNFPCAVPTICIKCVARKYKCQRECQSGPGQGRQIVYTNTQIYIVVGGPLYYAGCPLPPSLSLCLCACWYIKAMSCCCCSCTWQLNLHMATVGSRKTHVITLPQLNGVDLLIMHKFTLLSHLSLSLCNQITLTYSNIMSRSIYIYE